MSTIDRIAPTLRPQGRVVMRQSWRDLTFLHWPVAAETLREHLPPSLTVDTFEGNAYVGLVPFTMRNVRPAGFPSVPWLSHFHETNVRTYVHDRGKNPGVWFFSLDAANPIAVAVARAFFGLNYRHAVMSVEIDRGADEQMTLRYRSRRSERGGEWAFCEVDASVDGAVSQAVPGTLEHFLVERYLLYSVRRGRLYSGQVHHHPYPIRQGRCDRLSESLLAANSLIRPDLAPLTHYVTGVDVDIFGLKQVN